MKSERREFDRQARAKTSQKRALCGSERSGLRKEGVDVIGLDNSPPAYAASFCVDKNTVIAILELEDPILSHQGSSLAMPFLQFVPGRLCLS